MFVLLFSVIAVDDLRGSVATVDLQLAVDLLGIVVDGVLGDDKNVGNITVAVTAANELPHLQLSGGELRKTGIGGDDGLAHTDLHYAAFLDRALCRHFFLEGVDQIGREMPVDQNERI